MLDITAAYAHCADLSRSALGKSAPNPNVSAAIYNHDGELIADGAPADILTSEVLERTYGAPMEVLMHGGMPVVLDHGGTDVARRLSGLS